MIPVPENVIASLARFDSPTLCNVIELCNVRPRNSGYFAAAIRALYPEMPPMVGHAVTATFRSATAAASDERPIGFLDQIRRWQEVPAPRVLVVQDLDDPPDGAVYGEIVATVLKAFGFVGLVTNGYGRDIQQVQALGLPCFTTGISVSHSYCRWLEINVPVNVGGVTVKPGDLIHGDLNGVTTVPNALAERIARGAELLVQAEDIAISGAKTPGITVDSYAQVLERFLARHEEIAKFLSGQGLDPKVGI